MTTSVAHTIRPETQGYIIVDTEYNNVQRNRDFGRVEAMVTLFVKESGRPIRPVRIRTNAPVRGAASLRERLRDNAVAMFSHLGRLPAPTDMPRAA